MDADALETINALSDATRRRVYEYAASASGPVGRDETAAATGIGRTLAAYHLDKLASEGLLSVAYERRSGRTGPGAGRPAKVYSRTDREVAVSVPPREYHVAARLLADAAAADTEGTTRRALTDAAERLGRELADGSVALETLLRERGYEPFTDEAGVVRMRNCPFHAVAQRQPEIVCGMNLALLRGLVDGREVSASLEPGPGRCCVALREPQRA